MAEKKKLFGNVGGNSFRLLTEGMEVTVDRPHGTEQVREGLKKVLANGGAQISYQRLQNVGYGYIKDITTAAKCALREARELAEEFGYTDDQQNGKFVKEDSVENEPYVPGQNKNSESDMSNPAEKREVQIGNEIIRLTQPMVNKISDEDWEKYVTPIQTLAKELIRMHGQE